MSRDANKATTTADGDSLKRASLRFGYVAPRKTTSGSASASSELRVVLTVGGMEPVERVFSPGDVLVGRRPSNDLVIDGVGLKVVSGFHFRFTHASGRWCIEDKGSTNGTYLNGVRSNALQALRDGDIIELGRPRKTGTNRAVKLTVGLTGAAAVQATVDAAPADAAPPDAAPSDRERKTRTVAPAAPTLEAAPRDAQAKPARTAVKMIPAVQPARIRELIDQVQAKSRRLGEVAYRLEAYVADLASAAIDRHVALDIAKMPGGAAVIDLIAKEERLDATLKSLESELPSLRTKLIDELAPLERNAVETKEVFDAAETQFKTAAQRRNDALAVFETAFRATTATLRGILAPVVDVIDEERTAALSASPGALLDSATGEPVWNDWPSAFNSGVREINARQEELGVLRAEAADAAEVAQRAEAEAKNAEALWNEARKEADDRRLTIEASVSEKERVFSESTAEIAMVRDSMSATAKEFINGILGAPKSDSGSLESLAGMQEARKLFKEVEVIQQELAELESDTF